MRYIIMCGGDYTAWDIPRQLVKINGETLVERTIRLLRECGVTDIAVSTNNALFSGLGAPLLYHPNKWKVIAYNNSEGYWVNGFYPTKYKVCYLMGDVVFSRKAVKTIVETETDDVEFFASAPPFDRRYKKPYAEPFAFKVVNLKHFWDSVERFKELKDQRKFDRDPMAWELWQIIKGTPINNINYTNYTVINDYTCDIDSLDDIKNFVGVNLEN